MNQPRARRRASLCLFALLLVPGCLPDVAAAQDEKGARPIALFDLTPPSPSATALAMDISNGYEVVISAAASSLEDDCLNFKVLPSRFSGEALAPMTASFEGGMFDYAVWGEVSGSEGAYKAVIRLGTARTRIVVVTVDVAFATAGEARGAGAALGAKLLQAKGGLAAAIGKFERDRRADNPSRYAMAPGVEMTVAQPEMLVGGTQDISVKLTDCDGELLKNRSVQLHADLGSISPAEVTTDEGGSARVRYTAPGKKGVALISLRYDYRKPSDGLVTPLSDSEGITIGRASGDGPPVWHVELELNRLVDTDFKVAKTEVSLDMAVGSRDEVAPMRLEFDIDRNRQPIQASVKANYLWRTQSNVGWAGMSVNAVKGEERGTKLLDMKFEMKRHVRPAEGVKELDAYDADEVEEALAAAMPDLAGNTQQPKDTARLKFDTTIPGKIKMVDAVNEKTTEMETLPTIGEEQTVKYLYDQPVNQDTLKLPLAALGSIVRFKTNSLRYALTFKPTLTFDKVAAPEIKIDDEDWTDKFSVKAYYRDWRVAIDPRVLGYPAKGKYVQASDWQVDPEFKKAIHSRAMAMVAATDASGGDFPAERTLREYLIVVDKFPELGFNYYLVACTTAPPGKHYTVQRFAVKKVTAAQWKQIKNAKEPWQNENTAGEAVNSFRGVK